MIAKKLSKKSLETFSAEDVANEISKIGGNFTGYRESIIRNGLNGKTICSLDEKNLKVFLDEIGITNQLHQIAIIANIVNCNRSIVDDCFSPFQSLIDIFGTCLDCFQNKTDNVSKFPEVLDQIKKNIQSNKLVIFSSDDSKTLQKLKNDLLTENISYSSFDVDKSEYRNEIHDHLKKISGEKFFPYIFLKGKFIGDVDMTLSYFNSGKLHSLLGIKYKRKNWLPFFNYFFMTCCFIFISASVMMKASKENISYETLFNPKYRISVNNYVEGKFTGLNKIINDVKSFGQFYLRTNNNDDNFGHKNINTVKKNKYKSNKQIFNKAEKNHRENSLNNRDKEKWSKLVNSIINVKTIVTDNISSGIENLIKIGIKTSKSIKKSVSFHVQTRWNKTCNGLVLHMSEFGKGLISEVESIGLFFIGNISNLLDMVERIESEKNKYAIETSKKTSNYITGGVSEIFQNKKIKEIPNSKLLIKATVEEQENNTLLGLLVIILGIFIAINIIKSHNDSSPDVPFFNIPQFQFPDFNGINLPHFQLPSFDLSNFMDNQISSLSACTSPSG